MILMYAALSRGGLMGGDCPDTMSYGNTTVFGTVQDSNGNPVSGVQVVIRKPKGICPQSYEINKTFVSNNEGWFIGKIDTHLGDHDVDVSIVHDGYPPCNFVSHPESRFWAIHITATVGDDLRVEYVDYVLDTSFSLTPTSTLERSA